MNLPGGTGYVASQPTYVTAVFPSDSGAGMGALFGEYVAKKYGWRNAGPPGCSYGGVPAGVAKGLKDRVAQVQAQGHPVVETGWVYTANSKAEIAAMPAAKPQAAPVAKPQAQGPSPQQAINGVYTGTYVCGKAKDFRLSLQAPETGLVQGKFTLYLPPGTHSQAYTYSLNGSFDPKTGRFQLNPLKWEGPEPPNIAIVGIKGTFDAQTRKITGLVDYPGCQQFEAAQGRDD